MPTRIRVRYPKTCVGKLRGAGPNGEDILPGDPPFWVEAPLDPMLARAGVVPIEDEEARAREAGNMDAVLEQLRQDNASLERRARLAEGQLEGARRAERAARDAERTAFDQLAEREARIAAIEESNELLQAELEAARRPSPPWSNAAPAKVLAFANAQRKAKELEPFGGNGAVSRATAWLDDDRDAFEAAWQADA